MRFFKVVIAILAALWLVASAALAAPIYTVTDMGTLGGASSMPTDMNDAGQVLGASSGTDGLSATFLWSGGVMTTVPSPGALPTLAYSLSDNGHVGGAYYNGSNWVPCIWDGSTPYSVATFGWNGVVLGVNNWGQGAGYAYNGTQTRAVIWANGGNIYDLGALGTGYAVARDINNATQIAGYAINGQSQGRAFVWQDGVSTDLGTLGGTLSDANAINENGAVVGYATTQSSATHAFLWESGMMTDLGALGGGQSYATELNDLNQVVGWSSTEEGGTGFLWDHGVMIDLNDTLAPGTLWQIIEADGINNRGQIAAYGMSSTGAFHALLLDPVNVNVPAPGALILGLVGMGLSGAAKKIRGQVM